VHVLDGGARRLVLGSRLDGRSAVVASGIARPESLDPALAVAVILSVVLSVVVRLVRSGGLVGAASL
jgi:hypothetical protein